MDADLGHTDPPRPAYLQTEAALPGLRGTGRLRVFSSRPETRAPATAAGEAGTTPAMTREQFEQQVADALATIPKRFRDAMRNIAIVVEDEPDRQLLKEMEIHPPDTLFGLYQGTPLTERRWDHGNSLPDRILLFQRPHEREAEDDDDLTASIAETLIHEVGHYFGLSEEEIEAIEERYWRGGARLADDD
jgi:predicted Zn-dependent protease with MMP-like domain